MDQDCKTIIYLLGRDELKLAIDDLGARLHAKTRP